MLVKVTLTLPVEKLGILDAFCTENKIAAEVSFKLGNGDPIWLESGPNASFSKDVKKITDSDTEPSDFLKLDPKPEKKIYDDKTKAEAINRLTLEPPKKVAETRTTKANMFDNLEVKPDYPKPEPPSLLLKKTDEIEYSIQMMQYEEDIDKWKILTGQKAVVVDEINEAELSEAMGRVTDG